MRKWWLLALLIGVALASAYAFASTQNLTGIVRVSQPPSATAIYLFDDDNGGTTAQTATLTPNDEMTLVVTIEDADGLDTLSSIRVVIYHSTLSAVDAADDPALHATIIWNSTGWYIFPSGSTWAIDTVNSSIPSTGTIGNATIVFTPGKVARYSAAGDWVIYVEVEDAQGLTGSNQLTTLNVAFYAELSVSSTTFDFGLGAPGAANKSLELPTGGYITLIVIANGQFGIKVTGDGWYNQTNTLVVDFSTFNSLLVDDDATPEEASETGLYPFWVRPTVAAPQWSGFAPTTESGTTINMYLYVTLPSSLSAGTYTTTITVSVVSA